MILTLKDQALLEEDEHGRVTGLKDDDDELENVHMKEAEVSWYLCGMCVCVYAHTVRTYCE